MTHMREKPPQSDQLPKENELLLRAMPVAQRVLRMVRDMGGIRQKGLDAARNAARGESTEELAAQLAGIDESVARKAPERSIAIGEEILARFNMMLQEQSNPPQKT